MSLQRQHFLLSYLKTLSVGPAGVRTHDLPHGSPVLNQLSQPVSRLNWNLEMLVFVEGGKPEYPEKNPQSRDRRLNQQQTQPTYDVKSGNQTQATLMGGECSRDGAIPAHTTLHVTLEVSQTLTHKILCL